MAWLENIAILVSSNILLFWLIAFIGTALWGDATFITLTILSVHFNIPLWIIFSAAFLGTLLGDTIWFVVGIRLLGKVKYSKKYGKNYEKLEKVIEQIFKNNYLFALTIVKFLYGTRVVTIIYLANKKIGYWRFLLYDLFATFGWVVVFGVVGWLAGIGFTFIVKVFNNIQLALTLLVLLIILFNIIQRKITKKLEKNKK